MYEKIYMLVCTQVHVHIFFFGSAKKCAVVSIIIIGAIELAFDVVKDNDFFCLLPVQRMRSNNTKTDKA